MGFHQGHRRSGTSRRPGPKDQIRVWSAGCASGQEAYSAAILLAEAIGPEDFRRRVKIYATDVDEHALAAARAGSYTEKELESVPADLRSRYFEPSNGRFLFRKDLRRVSSSDATTL